MNQLSDTPTITESLSRACALLSSGEVVAVPTETVYGLAAHACDDKAVAKIYTYKNRPRFNPLIIHVLDIKQAGMYGEISSKTALVADTFWPGPLTVVVPLKDSSGISKLCTAGLKTLAIRCPAHAMIREIIQQTGLPLAAPSANPSTRLSPTCALHVKKAFAHLPLTILEGGTCTVGLESTILDLSTDTPAILRHGSVSRSHLESVLGEKIQDHTSPQKSIKSPGQTLKHYSPSKPLKINVLEPQKGDGFLAFGPYDGEHKPTFNLSPSRDLHEAAANLFKMLHELDTQDIKGISVSPIPNRGLGVALNDRLIRASGAS